MYFDLQCYWRVLRHIWSLKSWPRRSRMLIKLLVQVPLEYIFHASFFLLDYVFFPALWRQKVEQPVFIIGHARSGTTLAHRLLAADGDTFSYFLYWEMFFPALLQKKIIRALGWVDENWLGHFFNRRLHAWDDKTFGPYRHIHNMSLWNSEEDQFVMRAAFVTQQWSLEVPMMDIIDVFHVDQMPEQKRQRWMHHYRECVKRQLLLNGGNKTHLSKNPVMSGWVQAIIEAFPDARIAVMMRNPAECIPSVLKLVELTWKSKGWTPEDYARSLEILTEISFASFHHPLHALANNPSTPQTVIDYRALTTEPRKTISQLYRALDIPLSVDFDQFLRTQEEKEKRHKTTFKYSIDDYEVSFEHIEKELFAFYEQYNWPRAEVTHASTN